jgi:hypothetical protein
MVFISNVIKQKNGTIRIGETWGIKLLARRGERKNILTPNQL